MVFKPKSYKLPCPILYMDNLELKHADNFKYLGFTFSFDQKNGKDMLRQLRNLYTKLIDCYVYSIVVLLM